MCFRHDAAGFDPLAIRRQLLEQGTFHLSTTKVAGRRHLRAVVTAPTSGRAEFNRLLDRIEALIGSRSDRPTVPASPDPLGRNRSSTTL